MIRIKRPIFAGIIALLLLILVLSQSDTISSLLELRSNVNSSAPQVRTRRNPKKVVDRGQGLLRTSFNRSTRSTYSTAGVYEPVDPGTFSQPNACVLTLCRNSDLKHMIDTLEQFEPFFNTKYQYPHVFLNDEEFDDDFKDGIKEAMADLRGVSVDEIVEGKHVEFGRIPKEHWGTGPVNEEKLKLARVDMRKKDIPYGASPSYHASELRAQQLGLAEIKS